MLKIIPPAEEILLEGFYDLENDGVHNFHWMMRNASIKLPNKEGNILKIEIGNPVDHKLLLTINTNSISIKLGILPGWHEYQIYIKECSNNLKLSCQHLLNVPDDKRELSLMFGQIKLEEPGKDLSVIELSGFHGKEYDGLHVFRWMEPNAIVQILKNDPGAWLLFEIKSPSAWPEKFWFKNEKTGLKHEIHILPGEWKTVGVPIEGLGEIGAQITLYSEYVLNREGEERSLSFMISRPRISIPSKYELNSALIHQEVFKKINTKSIGSMYCIDTCNKCNLKCKYCILENEIRKKACRPNGIERTKEYIKKFLCYATKCQPYISGEPFYNDDIWEVLEYINNIKDHDIEIEISSNGLLITNEIIDKLIMYGVTSLQISLNATTDATYKNLCNGNFEKLKYNIINISQYINQKKIEGINLSISYVMMRENMPESIELPKLAKELGVNKIQIWPLNKLAVDIKDTYSKNGFVFIYQQQLPFYYPNMMNKIMEEIKLNAVKFDIEISITPSYGFVNYTLEKDFKYPLNKSKFIKEIEKNKTDNDNFENYNNIHKCYFPWYNVCITTDGNFAPCIHLMYQGGIDNILGKEFNEVWNSKKMNDIRNNIINGRVPSICLNSQCPFVN